MLIIGLDQWFYSRKTESYAEAPFSSQITECNNSLNLIQQSWTKVYSDLYTNKIRLDDVLDARGAIGLNAVINSNGFRNDGSFYYGELIECPTSPGAIASFSFSKSLGRISTGGNRFAHTENADRELVNETGNFLDAAAKRGVHVVGFMPPYAPTVLDKMRKSKKYNYLDELYAALLPHFQRHQFSLFDFTDPRPLGGRDTDFADGIHAGEGFHVRMLKEMVQEDRTLQEYSSHAVLDELLTRQTNPLLVNSSRYR